MQWICLPGSVPCVRYHKFYYKMLCFYVIITFKKKNYLTSILIIFGISLLFFFNLDNRKKMKQRVSSYFYSSF